MSEWNFCPSCGNSLLGDSPVYCATCGSRLKAEAGDQDPPGGPGEDSTSQTTGGAASIPESTRHPEGDAAASLVVHHLEEGETRRVPEHVPYGLYRVTSWVELRDAAGNVITQDSAKVPSGMTGLLLADDRCASLTAELSDVSLTPLPLAPVIDVLGEELEYGVFIVGADIPVGTYRLEDGPTANGGTAHSWSRFDGLLNVIEDDYVDNAGGVDVIIQPEDFAFAFMGALRPTAETLADREAALSGSRQSQRMPRKLRKLTPLDELVEYVQSKQSASEEVLYIQNPQGIESHIATIALTEDHREYLKEWADYIYLQDIPLAEWTSQDFLNFSIITLHLAELESGESIVDMVNAYADSLELDD